MRLSEGLKPLSECSYGDCFIIRDLKLKGL